MFINSLKHPYDHKVSPNEEEDINRLLFDEVEKSIECALQRGYDADLNGKIDCANTEYESISYYFYLIEYINIIKRYADRLGIIQQECLSNDIKEKFKIDCVLTNLPCIGKKYRQDYKGFLLKGFEIAGIGFDQSICETCCEGISIMEIDADNLCDAFIIDTCDALQIIPPVSPGEFTTNEFINIERT